MYLTKTNKRAKQQKGLTLIELAIVGLFLGLLALFAVNKFSSKVTVGTKSLGLYQAADQLAQAWGTATANCGISRDITASDFTADTASAAGNLSALLGTGAVNSDYAACFSSSGIKTLNGLAAGPQGNEAVYGYRVSASTPAPDRIALTFTAVPEELILPLFNKYSSATGAATATTLPAVADTTDSTIRFSAATNGKRDLTIVRTL